jgi:hypothetical protein
MRGPAFIGPHDISDRASIHAIQLAARLEGMLIDPESFVSSGGGNERSYLGEKG